MGHSWGNPPTHPKGPVSKEAGQEARLRRSPVEGSLEEQALSPLLGLTSPRTQERNALRRVVRHDCDTVPASDCLAQGEEKFSLPPPW